MKDLRHLAQHRCISTLFLYFVLLCCTPKAWATFEGISISNDHSWDDVENLEPRISSLSDNGRYVAFDSFSRLLVTDDTKNLKDVFVRDRLSGTTLRISLAAISLEQGNGDSSLGSQRSIAGTYVVFESLANNLIGAGGDTNGRKDIFLHNLQNQYTSLVSHRLGFLPIPANGDSFGASISADGKHVVFQSTATDLVFGDSNLLPDIFLYDIQANQISRVNLSTSGNQTDSVRGEYRQPPSVNRDGTKVAFVSLAYNLVDDDTKGFSDIFVRDITFGTTTRVSVASDGSELNGDSTEPSISDDGCRVAFVSKATNAIAGQVLYPGHVYVRDLCKQTTTLVSQNTQGDQAIYAIVNSLHPAISGDGNRVVFQADALNLRNWGNPFSSTISIYVRDLILKTTQLVTVAQDGNLPGGYSVFPATNRDGSVITFYGRGSHIVPGAPETIGQVFAYYNTPPVVSFTVVYAEDLLTLQFDGHSSYDPDGVIVAYLWDFGDGSFSNALTPVHQYAKAGRYRIKLTVMDNAYAQSTFEEIVTLDANYSLSGGGVSCAFQSHLSARYQAGLTWMLSFGCILLFFRYALLPKKSKRL